MLHREHLEWGPETSARIRILETENKDLKEQLKKNRNNALQRSMSEKELRKKDADLLKYKSKFEEMSKQQSSKDDKFYKMKYEEEKELGLSLNRTINQLEIERDALLKTHYQVEDLTAENEDLRNEIISLGNRQDYQAENYVKELAKIDEKRQEEIKELHSKYTNMKTKYEKALADLVGQMKVMQVSLKKNKSDRETFERQANVEAAKVKSMRGKLDEAYEQLAAKDRELRKMHEELSSTDNDLSKERQVHSELQDLQQRYEKLNAETEQLREQKIDNEYILSNKEKIIVALEKQIKEAEINSAKETEPTNELKELLVEAKKSNIKVQQMMQEVDEKQQILENNEKTIGELQQKLQTAREEIEKKNIEMKNEIEARENKINKLDEQLQKTLAEVEAIIRHENNTDEIEQLKQDLQTANETIVKIMENEKLKSLIHSPEKTDELEKQLEETLAEVAAMRQKTLQEEATRNTNKEEIDSLRQELLRTKEDLQQKTNENEINLSRGRDLEYITEELKEKKLEIEQLQELLKEADSTIEAKNAELVQEKQAKQSKLLDLEENLDILGKELEKLRSEQAEIQNSTSIKQLEELQQSNEKLEESNNDLQKQLSKKKSKFDKLIAENEKLNESLDEALTDKVEAVQTAKKKEKEIHNLREMLREAHDTIDQQNALSQREEKYEKLKTYVEELQMENRKHTETISEQQQTISDLQQNLSAVQEKHQKQTDFVSQLKKLLIEQEEQIQELQDMLESEKNPPANVSTPPIITENASDEKFFPKLSQGSNSLVTIEEIDDKNHLNVPIVVISDVGNGKAQMPQSSSDDDSDYVDVESDNGQDEKLIEELINKYSQPLDDDSDVDKDAAKENEGIVGDNVKTESVLQSSTDSTKKGCKKREEISDDADIRVEMSLNAKETHKKSSMPEKEVINSNGMNGNRGEKCEDAQLINLED